MHKNETFPPNINRIRGAIRVGDPIRTARGLDRRLAPSITDTQTRLLRAHLRPPAPAAAPPHGHRGSPPPAAAALPPLLAYYTYSILGGGPTSSKRLCTGCATRPAAVPAGAGQRSPVGTEGLLVHTTTPSPRGRCVDPPSNIANDELPQCSPG
jgi:hypothetical protein